MGRWPPAVTLTCRPTATVPWSPGTTSAETTALARSLCSAGTQPAPSTTSLPSWRSAAPLAWPLQLSGQWWSAGACFLDLPSLALCWPGDSGDAEWPEAGS
ncbi:leucine rich repeat containing 25, isoform CRA_a [Homo sapiens]|uniref:LRRC25 protein n=1 Tax=Homo sapiens TaxID=9606 RepID=Q8TAB8_HUMAN